MFLLILFLLQQPVVASSVVTGQTYTIQRYHSPSKSDKFELPNSWCIDEKICKRFNARLDPISSKTHNCLCSCSLERAATFGIKRDSWQCVDNKEIREEELHDCKRINFINETDLDPLEIFKIQGYRKVNISSKIGCSVNSAGFSYQACDGGWSALTSSVAWGLQVTKMWPNSPLVYMLQVNEADKSKHLQGKVIKLVIPCDTTKFCLLFKIAGETKCPISNLWTPIKPSRTTSSTTHPLADTTTITGRTSVVTKTTISQATTTVSTYRTRLSTTYPTTADIGVNGAVTHEVPIALIAGSVGSAVIVLVVVIVIGLLFCLKRNTRHSSKHSAFPKKTSTRTIDTSGQNSVTLQTEAYESLAPTQDGFPRGVYVSRYKVPDKGNISTELCKRDMAAGFDPHVPVKEEIEKPEYDYAESHVVRGNVVKSMELREAVRRIPAKNAVPYYHVLEEVEKGASKDEEEVCVIPDENTPCVLQGLPNTLDPQDNFHKSGNEADDMGPYAILEEPISVDPNSDREKDPIGGDLAKYACYHVLEGAVRTSVSQGDGGYKELQSDGTVYLGYQPLHKYAYVDAGKIPFKKTA